MTSTERAANEDDWVTYVCTHCEAVFDASHDFIAKEGRCGRCPDGTQVKLRDLQALARAAAKSDGRNLRALASVEADLDFLPRRWMMCAVTPHDAERMAVVALEIRAVLLGKDIVDWRGWLAARYPEVPGAVRCVAVAVRMRLEAEGLWTPPEGDDIPGYRRDPYHTAFGEELAAMVADFRARIDAAPETA